MTNDDDKERPRTGKTRIPTLLSNDDDMEQRKRAAWTRIQTLVCQLPPCDGLELSSDEDGDSEAHAWGRLENGVSFEHVQTRSSIEFGSELAIEALVGVLEDVCAQIVKLPEYTMSKLQVEILKSKPQLTVGDPVQGTHVEFRLPTQPAEHRAAVFSETPTDRDTQRVALLMALTFLVTGIQETHREMESQSEYFGIGVRGERLNRLNAGISMVGTIQEVLKIPMEERLELGTNLVDYGITLATWAMRR
jgi:hypothetical protein